MERKMLMNLITYAENGIYFNDRMLNIPVKKDIWDKDRKRIERE